MYVLVLFLFLEAHELVLLYTYTAFIGKWIILQNYSSFSFSSCSRYGFSRINIQIIQIREIII